MAAAATGEKKQNVEMTKCNRSVASAGQSSVRMATLARCVSVATRSSAVHRGRAVHQSINDAAWCPSLSRSPSCNNAMTSHFCRTLSSRRALDAYYTPDSLALRLVGLLPIRSGNTVLEPHAGNGAFVKAARATGATVTACDINANAAGLAYANENRVGNFLTTSWSPAPDWVLGNPPFRGAEDHIHHALHVTKQHVVMLVRLGFLATQRRYSTLWRDNRPRCVWVLSARPSFTDGGTDASDYGWVWWDKAHSGGSVLDWLPPG